MKMNVKSKTLTKQSTWWPNTFLRKHIKKLEKNKKLEKIIPFFLNMIDFLLTNGLIVTIELLDACDYIIVDDKWLCEIIESIRSGMLNWNLKCIDIKELNKFINKDSQMPNPLWKLILTFV